MCMWSSLATCLQSTKTEWLESGIAQQASRAEQLVVVRWLSQFGHDGVDGCADKRGGSTRGTADIRCENNDLFRYVSQRQGLSLCALAGKSSADVFGT